ncbi:hypothetical protein ACRAWD_27565 [Caulobacter segnis]
MDGWQAQVGPGRAAATSRQRQRADARARKGQPPSAADLRRALHDFLPDE